MTTATPTAVAPSTGRSPLPDYHLPEWYDEQHARENATRYLRRTEVEATIHRYLEVKKTSKLLGNIPGNELSQQQWRSLWAADDELNDLYARLDRACALIYLPDGYRPSHLDHLAHAYRTGEIVPVRTVPMVGKLPVEHHASLGVSQKPLSRVPAGARVEATVTIASIRQGNGYVRLLLQDEAGRRPTPGSVTTAAPRPTRSSGVCLRSATRCWCAATWSRSRSCPPTSRPSTCSLSGPLLEYGFRPEALGRRHQADERQARRVASACRRRRKCAESQSSCSLGRTAQPPWTPSRSKSGRTYNDGTTKPMLKVALPYGIARRSAALKKGYGEIRDQYSCHHGHRRHRRSVSGAHNRSLPGARGRTGREGRA